MFNFKYPSFSRKGLLSNDDGRKFDNFKHCWCCKQISDLKKYGTLDFSVISVNSIYFSDLFLSDFEKIWQSSIGPGSSCVLLSKRGPSYLSCQFLCQIINLSIQPCNCFCFELLFFSGHCLITSTTTAAEKSLFYICFSGKLKLAPPISLIPTSPYLTG